LIGDHFESVNRHEFAVNKLRDFIKGRRADIEKELDGPAPEWKWPLGTPGYTKRVGEVTASFTAKWGTLAGSPFAPSQATLELKTEEGTATFATVAATAGPSQQAENRGDPSLRITGRNEG
ncbi:MAG TPA: hypothetical protein DCY13_02150, partial [Verrucomicrobiales bacterium]|nr:hypothetical protein [Verrucomicrobiales bacterium]